MLITNNYKTSAVYEATKRFKRSHRFIGDHHQYIGNSKYLFTYFVKHNPMTACYFVTDDRRGPHFISPKSEKADELINSARVVIVENDIPETLQPNGTLIQLHQGTPIMQLFLDSKEPIKI